MPEPSSGRPRLLIVDDEESIVPAIEHFARRLGFDVEYRRSGREALAALAELKPHVAMVDLQMPELGGIDVLKAVRAADPDCEVILMTGNPSVDTAIEAVKAGPSTISPSRSISIDCAPCSPAFARRRRIAKS